MEVYLPWHMLFLTNASAVVLAQVFVLLALLRSKLEKQQHGVCLCKAPCCFSLIMNIYI